MPEKLKKELGRTDCSREVGLRELEMGKGQRDFCFGFSVLFDL